MKTLLHILSHVFWRHGLLIASAIVFVFGTPAEGAFIVAAAFYMKLDDIFAVLLNTRQTTIEVNVGKPATQEGESK